MENNEQKPKQVNIEDMNAQQSLEALWTLINKASTKGVFNIDESYVIKVLFSKISQEIVKPVENKESKKDSTNYNI